MHSRVRQEDALKPIPLYNSPMEQAFAERTQEKMKEVLMNPDADGPVIHYYMIRGGKEKLNITVMETGNVGGEYIKTYGHYHVFDFKETYKIIHGQGLVLLQVREKNAKGNYIDDEISLFKAIEVGAGDTVEIPSFAGHLLVNTGKTWLVTSDDSIFNPAADSSSMPQHADYEAVKKMRGFAYYVVSKDGKTAFIKNEKYKSVPEIEKMKGKKKR
jgi:glucose-6-phosphate isomerase